jgi:hypothetical protein
MKINERFAVVICIWIDGEMLVCQKIQIKEMREKTNTIAYKHIRQELRIFCPEVNMCISVLHKTETQTRIINIR